MRKLLSKANYNHCCKQKRVQAFCVEKNNKCDSGLARIDAGLRVSCIGLLDRQTVCVGVVGVVGRERERERESQSLSYAHINS